MSRIGRMTITVPAGVKVEVSAANLVTVTGPKGTLSEQINPAMIIEQDGAVINVKRPSESKEHKSLHGLSRTLINNMVVGVSQGFKKELAVIGVGYKVQVTGKKLVLNLGYSHAIEYDIPAGLTITVADGNKIVVEGADKQMVGQAAATIRSFRKPEPYKGKGIRYVDEQITLKEGKTVG